VTAPANRNLHLSVTRRAPSGFEAILNR
jgi:hypothetical protein